MTRQGETRVLNNGLEATIIVFRDFYDIDIMLSTGEVSCHQQYIDFQRCDATALGFYKKQAANEAPNHYEIEREVSQIDIMHRAMFYNYLEERKDIR